MFEIGIASLNQETKMLQICCPRLNDYDAVCYLYDDYKRLHVLGVNFSVSRIVA